MSRKPSPLDDHALKTALHAYLVAHGGDPNGGNADAVLAERDLERAVDLLIETTTRGRRR